jgi:hypothetical protein
MLYWVLKSKVSEENIDSEGDTACVKIIPLSYAII